MDIKKAHKLSSIHKEAILSSKQCGCFYCIKTYEPKEIKEWVDNGETALCPRCGVDAVLPENPGYTLNQEFLDEMCNHWFSALFDKYPSESTPL